MRFSFCPERAQSNQLYSVMLRSGKFESKLILFIRIKLLNLLSSFEISNSVILLGIFPPLFNYKKEKTVKNQRLSGILVVNIRVDQ